MTAEHFRMMALYNAWANRLLYDAARQVAEGDYHAARGAFFGSLHGTLNHVLVADRIWMRRFTGEGEAPTRLDETLFDDLPSLSAAREAEDARIIGWIESLDDAAILRRFSYVPIAHPVETSQPLGPALTHFFNHQTHHRGQAHCLLTQIAGAAPSIDLIYFQRETGVGLDQAPAL
ncbi:MAG: damage-inducible protein DinB [Salinarimonadaceae bacterium]|nr:MAG: damage-inducible protein DinB [Salinarimonadaceae bacterium]